MAKLAAEERVACRTPNPARPGVTRIPVWKFDLVRNAILEILREKDVRFSELTDLVRSRLKSSDLGRIGSLGWHVATVKLEMEVRGDIYRHPDAKPQVLSLGGKDDP
ncbi:MAG: hypothetical protein OXI01_02700 [Albidovulum sp.]|nr:hypothetical protein [Albidovulum sp.]